MTPPSRGRLVRIPTPAAPPAAPTGFAATAIAAAGSLPAGLHVYWVAALYPDWYPGGPISDWNAATVQITTPSEGAVELECNAMPNAIGYRWHVGADNLGERYWDTDDPSLTDDGAPGGGLSYVTTGATYVNSPAVPFLRARRGLLYWGDSTLPPWEVEEDTAPWVPFSEQIAAATGTMEFVPANGGTPAHIHFLRPGVYAIGLKAKAADATPWDLMNGFIGDIFGGSDGLFEDIHSGYTLANPKGASSSVSEILAQKSVVTCGSDDDAWRISARIANKNADGPRSVAVVELTALATSVT